MPSEVVRARDVAQNEPMKTIIAIDPGTVQSAYVVWNGERVIEAGTVTNQELLKQVLIRVMSQHDACLMVCEWVESYGMAVGKEVFETTYWTGRFAERWVVHGGDVLRIGRREVKLHHCQSARAKDSNIRAALLDKYPAGNKKAPGVMYGITSHKIAAFALATAWTESDGGLKCFDLS